MTPGTPPGQFPWRDQLAAALGALGWTPETFWSATQGEFRAALDGYAMAHGLAAGAASPVREELEAMMTRFPD